MSFDPSSASYSTGQRPRRSVPAASSCLGHLPTELISECLSFLPGTDLCVASRVGSHRWFRCIHQLVVRSRDPVSLSQHPRALAHLLVLLTALMDWFSLRKFLEQLRAHWYSERPAWFAGTTLLPADVAYELNSLVSEWNNTDGLNGANAATGRRTRLRGRLPRQLREKAEPSRVSLSQCMKMGKETVSPRTRVGLIWLFVLDLCELKFETIEVQVRFFIRNKQKLEMAARCVEGHKLPRRCLRSFWGLLQAHSWGVQRHGLSSESARFRRFLMGWSNLSLWTIGMFVEQQKRHRTVLGGSLQKLEGLIAEQNARGHSCAAPAAAGNTSASATTKELLKDLEEMCNLSHTKVLTSIGNALQNAEKPASELLCTQHWAAITDVYRDCTNLCRGLAECAVEQATVAKKLRDLTQRTFV